jgi:hypothetical protein
MTGLSYPHSHQTFYSGTGMAKFAFFPTLTADKPGAFRLNDGINTFGIGIAPLSEALYETTK